MGTITRLVRPGLAAVVRNKECTAYSQLVATGAKSFLDSLPAGTEVYAKTGTLGEEHGVPTTSRLVLAIVRWGKDDKIERGLVFSLVIERGELGLASKWLGEFLTAHGQDSQ